MTVNRREFCSLPAAALLVGRGATAIRWSRKEGAALFHQVEYQGMPLVFRGTGGVLTARCSVAGRRLEPAQMEHRLLRSGAGQEDLLEARLTLRNPTPEPVTMTVEFLTSAYPARGYGRERAHLPLTAGKHDALKSFGLNPIEDCERMVGKPTENSGPVVFHYREPQASEPGQRTSPGLLLIPLIDLFAPETEARIALFASPERAWAVLSNSDPRGEAGWCFRTQIAIPAGGEIVEKAYLLVHASGGPEAAWKAFHRFAHADAEPVPGWLNEVRVHYYDFLSPGADGARGGGFDLDAAHFREFRVGLATQHGYYPCMGDYIHPGRKQWQAMRNDLHGAAAMSLDLLRARVKAAREAGAKAAIYLHTAAFDSAGLGAAGLKDAILVDSEGTPRIYPWQGPDNVGQLWHMSLAAPAWRKHLLQQAEWIMELLSPDAIVVDETFGGLGYDYHPDRRGPCSGAMIDFMSRLRKLVHSYGTDRAVLGSDCSLGSFVLWADGEAGDHAYGSLLGSEFYRKTPVRYLAALGDKPWLPCAWQFTGFWKYQMELARKTGAGVGVSNGWIEYTGLTALPDGLKRKLLADIETLGKKGGAAR